MSLLRVNGITKIFGGLVALSNVTFSVNKGEILGLIGPNGAGKTSLFRMIFGEESIDEGEILIAKGVKMGYLPQAVVNYLVRLGWSYGDQEEFTRDELIEKFSLEAVGKSAAAINPGKLDWLNSQYIKKIELEELIQGVRPFIEAKGYTNLDPDRLGKAISSLRERVKTLVEMADLSEFYFSEEIVYDEKAAGKFLTADSKEALQQTLRAKQKL
jgi:glutamyl-tRNA synthetase